jgi:hypothetical protein
MRYENFTWTLPTRVDNIPLHPQCHMLRELTDNWVSDIDLLPKLNDTWASHRGVQQVANLHNAYGYPCNVSLLAYLKYAGLDCRYLKRYVLAHTPTVTRTSAGDRISPPTPQTCYYPSLLYLI